MWSTQTDVVARIRVEVGRAGPALAVLLLAAMLAAGCGGGGGVTGSGTVASETRDVEPFTKVRVLGFAEIAASIGGLEPLVVETDDNLLELLETDVEGDTLTIRFREKVRETSGVRVEMTVPALEGVTINGSADLGIEGMSGGALELGINGSGAVRATGTADLVEIDINGSGVVRMFELAAEEVDVSISGNGNVEVYASRSLEARLSGSGTVVYDGDPDEVVTNVSGSGSIERR